MELQIAAIKKPSVKPTPLGYLLQVSQTSFGFSVLRDGNTKVDRYF